MKAILVLNEMPEACGPCRFSERGDQPHCIASGRAHAVDLRRADRPDWCPIKEMPKKEIIVFHIVDGEIQEKEEVAFKQGWNSCLEEIEK